MSMQALSGRASLAIPCSTLAQCVGICGVRLQLLVDALNAEILTHHVLHAAEDMEQTLLRYVAFYNHHAMLLA